ncbi:MAG: molybdopterin-dependent oxidoreductase, partial [Candidatus Omnitrophica bacterium]|nr:molybdopterin-dependent oxidoreductase [Candidatus Omnitrophota bacterium]
DEAIQIVGGRLKKLRDSGEPHKVGFLTGEARGVLPKIFRRFLTAYGSPNFLTALKPEDGLSAALSLTQSVKEPVAYDIENTNYILSFGADFLGGWGSPIRNMRAYAHLRQGRPGRRAKLVQIEPRLSMTGAKADEWVPLNPDAYSILASGIAYVIITERLFDREFIESHVSGFEEWSAKILKEYSLSNVSDRTNIPPETILRLAREFAQNKPSLSIGDSGGGFLPGSVQENLDIYNLNVLTGNIGRRGGILLQRELPLAGWKEPEIDEVAKAGLKFPVLGANPRKKFLNPASMLPEAVSSGVPYGLESLFIYNLNPFYEWQKSDTEPILRKVPFIVTFSSFLDETAMQADVVLPEHTFLERWQDAPTPPGVPYQVCGMTQPVIKPLYDTRSPGDVILQVSNVIGGSVSSSMAWKGFKDALQEDINGLYDAQRGYVFGTPFEETWHRLLEKVGWWAPTYRSSEELWEQMLDKGGWWDPNYTLETWKELFRTESGKFEFKRYEAGGRSEIRLGEKEFYLLPFGILTLSSGTANLPFIQEVLGPHVQMEWDSWLEINPESAKRLGIKDGERIAVLSRDKKVICRAKIYPGIRPDCVALPMGLGREASGRWANNRGINPVALFNSRKDELSGISDFLSKVRIERV